MLEKSFTRAANAVAYITGLPVAFIACLALVLGWAVSGPLFGFSDTWQLIINTGTTIVTFLMVFLIQNTQNRGAIAVQIKLDELLRVVKGARAGMINVEQLSNAELEQLRRDLEQIGRDDGCDLESIEAKISTTSRHSSHGSGRVSEQHAERSVELEIEKKERVGRADED